MKTFPNGKKKALTLSYDDNSIYNLRLKEILDKNSIKCTFNLNGNYFYNGEMKPDRGFMVEDARSIIAEGNHEIATHGFTHPDYVELSFEEADADIKKDIEKLTEVIGERPVGHAYPYGTYNEDVKKMLKDNNLVYARTTKATFDFGLPADYLEWHPTCRHMDENLFELAEKFLADDNDDLKLFYLWGHASEFNRDKNWDLIEKFAEILGNRDDIWYCTNGEFYSYFNVE